MLLLAALLVATEDNKELFSSSHNLNKSSA